MRKWKDLWWNKKYDWKAWNKSYFDGHLAWDLIRKNTVWLWGSAKPDWSIKMWCQPNEKQVVALFTKQRTEFQARVLGCNMKHLWKTFSRALFRYGISCNNTKFPPKIAPIFKVLYDLKIIVYSLVIYLGLRKPWLKLKFMSLLIILYFLKDYSFQRFS